MGVGCFTKESTRLCEAVMMKDDGLRGLAVPGIPLCYYCCDGLVVLPGFVASVCILVLILGCSVLSLADCF